jgi:HAD superfamily hydrolase (TIGR01509 family)
LPLDDCQHWIFDMDGTLTVPVHDFNDIRRQIGIPPDTPILEAISQMSPADAARTRRALHDIEMDLAALAQPQPDALGVLEKLACRGGTLGILTRNDEDIAEATLRACGLHHLFPRHHVVGRETCAPKPLPDGVLHLLALWDAQPASAVMVGDFLYDIEAGRRAGVRTVHFDTAGRFPWPQFTDHGITALGQLLELTSQPTAV